MEQNGNISDVAVSKQNLMFLTISMRMLMLLREFHVIGLIHRDIKPANMTLKQDHNNF